MTLLIIISAKFAHSQNIDVLEMQLKSLTNPQKKQKILENNLSFFVESGVPNQNHFLLLYGIALQENHQTNKALDVFNQSLASLTPLKETHRALYIKTLNQRSYAKYLQANDPASYCPDRKAAFDALTPEIAADLKVLTYSYYSYCFRNGKSDFYYSIELLDRALKIALEHNLPPRTLAMIYNAVGIIYLKNQMFSKSYDFILNAYMQWEKVKDYKDMHIMLHNLIVISIEMLNFEQAREHAKEMFRLADEQKAFIDFLFFANYNLGIIEQAESNIAKSNHYFITALNEKSNTSKGYFIKQAFEQLIINFLHTDDIDSANKYLLKLQLYHPEYESNSLAINAFIEFKGESFFDAVRLLLQNVEQEKKDRRLFVKYATESAIINNSKSIAELDKKVLRKTVRIQELKLEQEKNDKQNMLLIFFLGFLLCFGLSVFCYYLIRTRKTLKIHANTDYLTRAYNRRYLFEKGARVINDAQLNNKHVAILLLDIDNFKNINDSKGHYAGDMAIKHVVEQCKKYLPKHAFIGRLGGDEFLIIIPEQTIEFTIKTAEYIRRAVVENTLELIHPIPLTISIGIVSCSKKSSLDDVIAEADDLLYQAKEGGRNLVIY